MSSYVGKKRGIMNFNGFCSKFSSAQLTYQTLLLSNIVTSSVRGRQVIEPPPVISV